MMWYDREEQDKGLERRRERSNAERGRGNEECLLGGFPLDRSEVMPSLSRLFQLSNTRKRVSHSKERREKQKNIHCPTLPAIVPYLTPIVKVAAVRSRRNRRVESSVLLRVVVALYLRQGLRRPRLSLRVSPSRRRPLCQSQARGVHQHGLAETWVENDVAMSNGNGSSRTENIVGLRLSGGAMEKKSPELSIRGLRAGLESPLVRALLGERISLNGTGS